MVGGLGRAWTWKGTMIPKHDSWDCHIGRTADQLEWYWGGQLIGSPMTNMGRVWVILEGVRIPRAIRNMHKSFSRSSRLELMLCIGQLGLGIFAGLGKADDLRQDLAYKTWTRLTQHRKEHGASDPNQKQVRAPMFRGCELRVDSRFRFLGNCPRRFPRRFLNRWREKMTRCAGTMDQATEVG